MDHALNCRSGGKADDGLRSAVGGDLDRVRKGPGASLAPGPEEVTAGEKVVNLEKPVHVRVDSPFAPDRRPLEILNKLAVIVEDHRTWHRFPIEVRH